MSQNAPEPPAAAATRSGVPSYKQLVAELEATKAKLRAVTAAAERAKKAADQAQIEAVEEARRSTRAECEAAEAARLDKERNGESMRERVRLEEAERVARDAEATQARRMNELVTRTGALYESKFSDMRNELLLLQRAYDEQHEQLRALQEWQKAQMLLEQQWNELKKSLEAECAAGAKAAENLARYKTILKFMAVHKYVKDVKLKKRLLPLHTSISKLIALILKDDDLRNRLIHQQAELARWVHDAHNIERSEGIVSGLPLVGREHATTGSTSSSGSTSRNGGGGDGGGDGSGNGGGGGGGGNSSALAASSSQRGGLMMATSVEYLVASLIEVEHVLHTCVGTVLRYSAHFKTTSAGFFERNSGLTAYCMAVEKEHKDTKARAARTAAQLHATLGLLARLEIKYSNLSRKLGKEDRVLAQRYLARHGISFQATAAAAQTPQGEEGTGYNSEARMLTVGTGSTGSSPSASIRILPSRSTSNSHRQSVASELGSVASIDASGNEAEAEDLSILSPRALHRRVSCAMESGASPPPFTGHHRRGSSTSRPASSGALPPASAAAVAASSASTAAPSPAGGGGSNGSGSTTARTNAWRSLAHRPAWGAGAPRSQSRSQERQQPSNPTPSFSPRNPRVSLMSRPLTSPSSTPLAAPTPVLHVPSAVSASFAYSAGGTSSAATSVPSASTRARRRRPKHSPSSPSGGGLSNPSEGSRRRAPVDVYESSSSDEEFTLRPVSFTPPPSNSAIRASDWEAGDEFVKVDGFPVRIDPGAVPTIAQALSGALSPRHGRVRDSSKKSASSRKHVLARGAQSAQPQSPENQEREEKENSTVTIGASMTLPHVGASSATAEEKEASSESGAPRSSKSSSSRRHRDRDREQGSSGGGGGVTMAWGLKVAAANEARQARDEMARAAAQEESVGGLAAASAHLMSSKARLAQPSPYQDPFTFGVHNRTGSAGSAATAQGEQSSGAGGAGSASARIVPRPPPAHTSTARSQRRSTTAAGMTRVDPPSSSGGGSRTARARSSSHERVRPSKTLTPLRPAPPATARPASSSAAAAAPTPAPSSKVYVLNSAAALAPLPPPQIGASSGHSPTRPTPKRAPSSKGAGKRTASASPAPRPPSSSSGGASSHSVRKSSGNSTRSSSRPSGSTTVAANTASTPAQPPRASAAARSSSGHASQPQPTQTSPTPPTVSVGAAPAADTDAYVDDEFDQSDGSEAASPVAAATPAAAASSAANPAPPAASAPAAATSASPIGASAPEEEVEADYGDEFDETPAAAPTAAAPPVEANEYEEDFD